MEKPSLEEFKEDTILDIDRAALILERNGFKDTAEITRKWIDDIESDPMVIIIMYEKEYGLASRN